MNIFDLIRQSNADKGEAMGQLAALQAAQAAQQQQAAPQPQQAAAIAPALAKQATGTDVNPATGGPMDLETTVRVYQQNKRMNGAMTDDIEQKLMAAGQGGQLPAVLNYLPDDGKKLLDKMQKNGNLGFGDAARLNGMLSGALKTQEFQSAQQYRDMQNKVMQQKMAEAQRDNQEYDAQAGVLNRYLSAQTPAAAMLSPEAIARYKQLGDNPAFAAAAQLRQATGRNPSAQELNSFLAADGRKVVDPVAVGAGINEKGVPMEQWIDRLTGKVMGIRPVAQNRYVRTPEEEAQVEGQKHEAEDAAAYINSISANAEAAQPVILKNNQIRALYAGGAKSGAGQQVLNDLNNYAARLNLIPAQKVATAQELQQLFAQDALQNATSYMKGQGSISEGERKLIAEASANIGKSPEANLAAINISDAIAQRRIAAENTRQHLVDAGLKGPQLAEALRRWHSSNPIDKFMQDGATKPTEATKPTKSRFQVLEVK